MSRIVSNKTKRIQLSESEWVDIKHSIPYAEIQSILVGFKEGDQIANAKMAIPLLKAAIVGWNFKDEDGNEVPYSLDKVDLLDTNTVLDLTQECSLQYFPQKKGLAQSEE